MELKITPENCTGHRAKDIKSSKIFRDIPNFSRYRTKFEMCNAIKLHYRGTTAVSPAVQKTDSDKIREGIKRFHLNYQDQGQKDKILFLINLLDHYWSLITQSIECRNNSISQLPAYYALNLYIIHNKMIQFLKSKLKD
jgi:hypothetical protein